ncbi:MAG: hypothetical protein RJB02_90 [Pseudomonadota bacterium]
MIFSHDPLFYAVAILAITLVGLAKGGFSGLGAASTPLLVLVMDPIKAAAMLLPILILQDVVGVWSFRKSFDRTVLVWMVPGAAVGIFMGWSLASAVNVDWVKGAVGAISLLFGIERLAAYYGRRLHVGKPLPEWVGSLWGVVAGFTSHIAHAGGPPFQAWTLGRGMTPTIYAGTAAIFFAIINWMKVPAYWQLGQFDRETLGLALLFAPVAIASTTAGVFLVRRVSPARFQLLVSGLMIILGAELIRQTIL